jgi:drug/metabolite transporter (DMT)-like permease
METRIVSRRLGAETVGALFVALAALLFGGTVVLGKLLANREFPVTSMLAIRFGIAAVLLAGTLALLRQPLRPARGEGRGLVALGAVGYAAESTLFFLALGNGTASAVTLLFFTYPALVAVYSAVLGMGVPGSLTIGSLVAAMAGAAIVVGSSGGLAVSGAGVAFALGSALTFSLYLIGVEVVLQRTSSFSASMWVSASASVALAVISVLGGEGRMPAEPREWWPIMGMGAFTAAAFSSLFMGLRRLGAVRTAIIAALEPVAAAGLAYAFLDEPLRSGTVAGGLLILVAAVTASLARRRIPETPVP